MRRPAPNTPWTAQCTEPTHAPPLCCSHFLESPAETRKTAEALAAKPDPKRARDDEKVAPAWNYGLTTDPADLADLPSFAALAQMRLHLADEAAAASAQLGAPDLQEQRAKLLELLAQVWGGEGGSHCKASSTPSPRTPLLPRQRLEDERKAKCAKAGGGAGDADASASGTADAAPARPLPAAVALGIQAVFSFLAGAAGHGVAQ